MADDPTARWGYSPLIKKLLEAKLLSPSALASLSGLSARAPLEVWLARYPPDPPDPPTAIVSNLERYPNARWQIVVEGLCPDAGEPDTFTAEATPARLERVTTAFGQMGLCPVCLKAWRATRTDEGYLLQCMPFVRGRSEFFSRTDDKLSTREE